MTEACEYTAICYPRPNHCDGGARNLIMAATRAINLLSVSIAGSTKVHHKSTYGAFAAHPDIVNDSRLSRLRKRNSTTCRTRQTPKKVKHLRAEVNVARSGSMTSILPSRRFVRSARNCDLIAGVTKPPPLRASRRFSPLASPKPLCYRPRRLQRPEAHGLRAGVVKLADTQDLGSCGETRGGSSPSARTKRCPWPHA